MDLPRTKLFFYDHYVFNNVVVLTHRKTGNTTNTLLYEMLHKQHNCFIEISAPKKKIQELLKHPNQKGFQGL